MQAMCRKIACMQPQEIDSKSKHCQRVPVSIHKLAIQRMVRDRTTGLIVGRKIILNSMCS